MDKECAYLSNTFYLDGRILLHKADKHHRACTNSYLYHYTKKNHWLNHR